MSWYYGVWLGSKENIWNFKYQIYKTSDKYFKIN